MTPSVTNVATFGDATDQTLTGSYSADGAVRLTGGMGIANLAVGTNARTMAPRLTGALDLNNNADISGALTQGGVATFHSNVNVTAGSGGATKFAVASASGNTDIRGTLDIGGDVTAESILLSQAIL